MDFSHLITEKTSTKKNKTKNVPLTCCKPLCAKFRYPDKISTTSRTIRRLSERFNATDVRNDSTRTESPRVTTHGRNRHYATSDLQDRRMPAVLTARNTSDTHNNSAAGSYNETIQRFTSSVSNLSMKPRASQRLGRN